MMKTKKKGIAKLSALILALVLAVGMLAGCSGSDEEETTAVQTTEAAAEEETEAAEPEETEAAQTEETEGSSAGLSGSAEDETDADGEDALTGGAEADGADGSLTGETDEEESALTGGTETEEDAWTDGTETGETDEDGSSSSSLAADETEASVN